MTKLFKLITAFALAGALSLLTAQAQVSRGPEYGVLGTLGSAGTGVNSTIVASSFTNGGYVLNCTKSKAFTLAVSFKLMGAGTSALDFQWDLSPDGTNWCSAVGVQPGAKGWFGGPVGNGTTPVYWQTNIDVGTAGYYRIQYITNGSAAVVTNLLIKAYTKTGI